MSSLASINKFVHNISRRYRLSPSQQRCYHLSSATLRGVPSMRELSWAPLMVVRGFHSTVPVFKKGKKNKKGGKGMVEEPEEDEDEDNEDGEASAPLELPPVDEYESKLAKCLSRMNTELAKMRGGAITRDMFNSLSVSVEGNTMNILEIAQISMKGTNKFTFNMFDPSLSKAVADALKIMSNDSINPQQEGSSTINIVVPKPSLEARQAIVKQVIQISEKCKLDVRNIRKSYMDKAKKRISKKGGGGVSEDAAKRFMKDLEKTVEGKVAQVTKIAKQKEDDILK